MGWDSTHDNPVKVGRQIDGDSSTTRLGVQVESRVLGTRLSGRTISVSTIFHLELTETTHHLDSKRASGAGYIDSRTSIAGKAGDDYVCVDGAFLGAQLEIVESIALLGFVGPGCLRANAPVTSDGLGVGLEQVNILFLVDGQDESGRRLWAAVCQ